MPTPVLPTSPQPVSYKITSKVHVLKSESLSGHIRTRKVGGQRFEATLVYPPMNKNAFNEIHAFLMSQEGSAGIFYVQLPTFGEVPGGPGEYFNKTNHSKLYMHKGDGAAYPDLLYAGGTEATETYMRCALKNSIQVIEYKPDGTVRIEIDLEERL